MILRLVTILLLASSLAGCIRSECRSTGAWGNLGILVNSPFDDYGPVVPDTTLLLFTSDRLGEREGGLRELAAESRPASLYRTLRLTGEWDRPLRYDILREEERDQEVGTATFPPPGGANGVRAYASSCYLKSEEIGAGGCDIVAISGAEGFAEIRRVPGINSPAWEGHPYATPDGRRLYFASDRTGGMGGSDIWYVEIDDRGLWSAPRNAGAEINTMGDESSPFIDAATGDLYFAAMTDDAGLDIHVLRKGEVSRERLPSPYNTTGAEITPWLIGGHLYLASDREGGCGGFDLYRFPMR